MTITWEHDVPYSMMMIQQVMAPSIDVQAARRVLWQPTTSFKNWMAVVVWVLQFL